MLLPHFDSFGILESALKSLVAQGVENRPKFSLGLAHYDLFGSKYREGFGEGKEKEKKIKIDRLYPSTFLFSFPSLNP